jgi:chromosome segregation ATPase
MKDEIKEILDNIKKCCEITKEQNFVVYQRQDIEKLLDYITNLQEENNNLKEDFKRHIDRINELTKRSDNLQEENERLKRLAEKDYTELNIAEMNATIYKSRCEEAIEFIEEKISSTQGVINDYMYHKEHNKILIELLQEDIEMYKNELNILNGGDEE